METAERKETYNGWKNYATWNVALWIGNDEGLYNSARDFMRTYTGRRPYSSWVESMGLCGERTPDRCAWDGAKLDRNALNEMMREL